MLEHVGHLFRRREPMRPLHRSPVEMRRQQLLEVVHVFAQERAAAKTDPRRMRGAGLQGVMRNRFVRTTVRDREAAFAPDLVDRNFGVGRSDQLWVADITYVPTWAGFLYLAVVIDAFSRKIVGWAMETHLRTELVLAALNMAYAQRRPDSVIHHSDRGTQARVNRSSQQLFCASNLIFSEFNS